VIAARKSQGQNFQASSSKSQVLNVVVHRVQQERQQKTLRMIVQQQQRGLQ
jgi:hypothetical protein